MTQEAHVAKLEWRAQVVPPLDEEPVRKGGGGKQRRRKETENERKTKRVRRLWPREDMFEEGRVNSTGRGGAVEHPVCVQ